MVYTVLCLLLCCLVVSTKSGPVPWPDMKMHSLPN